MTNQASKIYFQKVQAHINEKLLVVYAFFEIEIFLSMMEDIAKVKLENQSLETIKKDILIVVNSENNSRENIINKLKNKYSSIQEKLYDLYKTHLGVLNKSEKIKLFSQILNNLKLPDLLKEKEKLKKIITDETNKNEIPRMVSKYNLLIDEINIIKKKS